MDSEKSLLAAERAKKAVQESKDALEKKKTTKPAVVPIAIDYFVDDDERSVTLPVKVLNFDERNHSKLLAATLANGKFNSLPADHAEYLLGLATIYTMWPSEIPKDLQNLLHEDENLVLNIYSFIEAHRTARFQGNGATGKRNQATVRLADVPT